MSFGLYEFLSLIGALGLFIFGMKIMSDGIQKFAGDQMRSILRKITQNRIAGIFTGFGTTAIIQSSSATTVMIVSFVNAGLLSLRQAIGVIMGANIGTTVTAFLLLAFGFGKFSISDYSLPIIAIGLPLFFMSNSKLKSFGEFLIGFAILFRGLDALKDLMSFIKEDPTFIKTIIEPLDQFGFGSVIIFVGIGTLLTVVVQSSSAAMAITLSLCGGLNGLPLELAAAIILGENIGTTITANMAAMIGNVHAKRAARAHLFFNVIGVLWMLAIFDPFLKFVDYLVSETFFNALIIDGDSESTTRWSLAVYHLSFNIVNTLLLLWFIPHIERLVVRILPSKTDDDEMFQLKFFSSTIPVGELSLLEAQREVVKLGKIVSRMNTFCQTILMEKKESEFRNYIDRIAKYEDITDKIEEEVARYLTKVSQNELSERTSEKIRAMLSMVGDMERIADIYYQISKTTERKRKNKIWFTPEQRERLVEMYSLMNLVLENMCKNLEMRYSEVELTEAKKLEKSLNKLRKEIRKEHFTNVEKGEYRYDNAAIYSDLFNSLEKIGDHAISVTQSITGEA
jgi:phosphate:Na+ symporter